MPPAARVVSLLIAAACLAGCVHRTITIRTEPPGALVWLNDREVGRTPLDVEFLYYGTYDVRLVKDGYEPLLTSGKADAPVWDWIGIDLVAEVLPLDFKSHIEWDYTLQPLELDEAALIERARAVREEAASEPPAAAPAGESATGDGPGSPP